MNKRCQMLLILLFCFFAIPARGQKPLDETIKKNVALESDIELLKKDSIKIKTKISTLILNISKESIKLDSIIKKNEAIKESISQEHITRLQQHTDSLEKVHQELLASIKKLREEISGINRELANTDSELNNMSIYSEIQKEQTYKNNMSYLTQKYSQISMDKLKEMANSLDEFKAIGNISDYKNRVYAAINNKKKYDIAWECVSKGNNYQNVDALRDSINILLNIKSDNERTGVYKLSTEQFNEMDSLDIKLSRINNGISELKKIVSSLNSDQRIYNYRNEKKAGTKRDCLETMKQHIFPKEGSEQAKIHERYFEMIPYLNNLLKDYWNELKVNPFVSPTKSEKIIMNLTVK